MGGSWARSKPITDKSWAIVKENKELYRFPVTGAGAAVVTVVVLGGPAIAAFAFGDSTATIVLGVVLIVIALYVAMFFVTLFNAGLVAAADRLLAGEAAGYAEGMAEAKQHMGPIAGWAGISLLVGWILQLVQGGGDDGIFLTIVRTIAAALLATAWALLSFFVMPVIVLEELGPIAAVKRSASLVKSRWGDALVGDIRIGWRAGWKFAVPGVVALIGGVALALAVGGVAAASAGALLIAVGLVLLVIAAVIAATARAVFGVALYRYALSGDAVGPFAVEDLDAVVTRKAA